MQCYYKQRIYNNRSTIGYFIPHKSKSVYSYEWNTEQWNELPSCPYPDCALIIIDGKLTTACGRLYRSDYTNKLFTLRQREWVEEYSPMNTARSRSSRVSKFDGDYIMGGVGDGGWTATVELFQVKTRRWYELTNIPQPLALPSATICGNKLHVTILTTHVPFQAYHPVINQSHHSRCHALYHGHLRIQK